MSRHFLLSVYSCAIMLACKCARVRRAACVRATVCLAIAVGRARRVASAIDADTAPWAGVGCLAVGQVRGLLSY